MKQTTSKDREDFRFREIFSKFLVPLLLDTLKMIFVKPFVSEKKKGQAYVQGKYCIENPGLPSYFVKLIFKGGYRSISVDEDKYEKIPENDLISIVYKGDGDQIEICL